MWPLCFRPCHRLMSNTCKTYTILSLKRRTVQTLSRTEGLGSHVRYCRCVLPTASSSVVTFQSERIPAPSHTTLVTQHQQQLLYCHGSDDACVCLTGEAVKSEKQSLETALSAAMVDAQQARQAERELQSQCDTLTANMTVCCNIVHLCTLAKALEYLAY